MGHALMENRNGLAVGGLVTQANGTAERCVSEVMLKKKAKGSKRITVGEDKAYDTSDHVAAMRRISVTPHIAQNDSLTKTGKRRRSAIEARTHPSHRLSALADLPKDDRVHLRLGQATRHDAQDQTSRYRSRRC